MSDHTSKAMVAEVDFGFVKVEGLMLPNGEYAIAMAQAHRLLVFSSSPNLALKSLKALLGKDLELPKVRTELANNPAYVLTIPQFKDIVFELATKKKNEIAAAFLKAALEETIERRFDTAFGKKVEEEVRNARLKARVEGILQRNFWTRTIDEYLETHEVSVEYIRFIYVNVSNAVNLAVFGMKAAEVREKLGLTKSQKTRDYIPAESLPEIAFIEKYAGIQVKKGMEPMQAVTEAIQFANVTKVTI